METREERHFFPLTSLQIGDLQSYLSRLTIFLIPKSKKFLILVDNRPWLTELDARPTHLWQFMVTKSRLSPFANSRGKTNKKKKPHETAKVKTENFISIPKSKSKWYSLIDAAVHQKKTLFPVKNLKNSFLLNDELHRTLYGFIVFEVEWNDVRGINYLNELQTDTSMAMEAKYMKRWEFDSVEQASMFVSSWYIFGTDFEVKLLQEYLDGLSNSGDIFHDAQNEPSNTENFKGLNANTRSNSTPRKRRNLSRTSSESLPSFSNFDPSIHKDIFISFKFSDRDLPFKLKTLITSDLRLLTLLEYGLPSWVVFFQSYPVFCKIYKPWMCPLGRALYVIISIITVLIGFYDLYKNVPVLKVTALRLFGPFSDWIESWEMVSRIRYLGTMLFLQNCEKALKWVLVVTRGVKSVFLVLTTPIVGPVLEVIELCFPIWNAIGEFVEDLFAIVFPVLGSLWSVVLGVWNVVLDILEIIIWPFWVVFSTLWNIVTGIIYPIFWLIWEILATPARLVIAISSFLGAFFVKLYDVMIQTWSSLNALFRFASTTETTFVTAYEEASSWKTLWNDIFSHVFRALRSILNGLVAFLVACNRHRLSIYNHLQEFFSRLSHATTRKNVYSDAFRRKRNCSNQKQVLVKCYFHIFLVSDYFIAMIILLNILLLL
ncbi:hypothetical protein LUZ60_002778 [Juncus effusus]|nr:hypothetical protein LUZ60_002778 [Juncus effusus]